MPKLWDQLRSAFWKEQGGAEPEPKVAAYDEATIRSALERPALPLTVGGFRPTGDLRSNVFGDIRAGLAGEVWPTHKGKPMWPLCQLNLSNASWRPDDLCDLDMITVWIAEDHMAADLMMVDMSEADPTTLAAPFFVRGYRDLASMVALDVPNHGSPLKPFEAQWADALVADYPNHDVAPDLPDGFDLYEHDWVRTQQGTKLGGWPQTIQSEPWWMYRSEGAEFEYVLQIDSEPKPHWMWGDSGCGYLARSRENPNRWALDFQFF